MITSCASPAASITSATSSHAHHSPRWVSTLATIPSPDSRARRAARYCAVAPSTAERTTTHRSAYP
jgi:hypothetical protein